MLLALPLFAQRGTGELRLTVTDAQGAGVEASGTIVSDANQIRQTFRTDAQGCYSAEGLPFGAYRLEVSRSGFAPFSEVLQIDSAVPFEHQVTLQVAAVETTVTVTDSATLLDTARAGSVYSVGSQALAERPAATPGRDIIEMVNDQPGWLVEANGVLHPRGSEYDTQYVIDGVPIVDNRSPTFAPSLDVTELQSLRVSTADYPAEYGRKLGGVVELNTSHDSLPGFHGKAAFGVGSFSTEQGTASGQYVRGRTAVSLSVLADHSDRYLDPPVEENFTNKASDWGFTTRFERDFSSADRLRVYIESRQVGFLVPNEHLQEAAGQRQDRTSQETMAQVSYQHVFGPNLVGVVQAMARDLRARLWSNAFSTPIEPAQDRGFREGYFDASLSAHYGAHELKAGTELVITPVHEQFAYTIIDPGFFDPSVPPTFSFAGRQQGNYEAAFIQDQVHTGHWTASAGLRWDRYQLLINDHALSPRLELAYYWPRAGIILHASYDRAFQIPAIENLLLASSVAAQHLASAATGLPVPASRGDFYQAGISKSLFGRMRFDANYYRRNIRNFEDDDLLLNTGVSFPTTFARASIYGLESKLELPRWNRFSGWLSYSNMLGIGTLPVTGGLFLDPGSSQLLQATDRFAISQDQRNTVRSLVRCQLSARAWISLGAWYGSGLPTDLPDDTNLSDLITLYGPRILSQVDLARGRVRPSHAVDLSGGVDLWKHEHRDIRLQADLQNLTNRLNLINFASLFSGTALYSPRSFVARLQTSF